jgi:ATP-dependent Zn protease
MRGDAGAFERARAILAHNRALLEERARELLERATLTEADLRHWFEKVVAAS